MTRGISLLFAGLMLAGTLAACGTMEGFGRDVQVAGETLERQAQGSPANPDEEQEREAEGEPEPLE